MRSFRLHLQLSFLVCFAAISTSGCHTMGGYAANTSGMGHYAEGNYTAAANEFQQAMMVNPSNPDYVANLAKARMKLGDTQGAEQLYRQALSLAPSHQPAYHGLAETMIAAGRSEEAASLLTSWAATQPYVPEAHIELAWIQREMGQNDIAVQSLQRALQVNPNHATALAQLGQHYEETGHSAEAVAVYQRSLQADWNQPEVHSRIAAASQSAGAASPMAATAMARGVHPYEIPRQQTAFGPPSAGAQLAQMRMAQTQMAMSGNSMSGPPGQMYGNQMPGSQMATGPGSNSGMMSTYYAPQSAQQDVPSFGTRTTQWQPANSIANQPSDQTASMSFGTGASETGSFEIQPDGQEWQFENTVPSSAPFQSPPQFSPNTAVVPTPDPAFSSTGSATNVSNVSWSASGSRTPITNKATSDTPLVEAF